MSKGFAFWLLPQSSMATDRVMRRLALALTLTGGQVAASYGVGLPTYQIASTAADIPSDGNEVPIVFSKTINNPAFAAYHEWLDGRPFALVLADPEQVSLPELELAAGHESDETNADPTTDVWVTLPSGLMVPREADDAVQADKRLIDIGEGELVTQSNHVLPAWFEDEVAPGTPLDWMGLCTVPREVRPGGYMTVVDAAGNVRQIGAGVAAMKRSPIFRHGRRLAQAHSHALRIRLAA